MSSNTDNTDTDTYDAGADFKKFDKIGLTSAKFAFRSVRDERKIMQQTDWVATEKIHGSNVCFNVFGSDRDTVTLGRRNGFITPKDKFFYTAGVVEAYGDKVKQLAAYLMDNKEAVESSLASVERVSVFGELFGGGYPHKDVEQKEHTIIQEGLYYTPDIDWWVFDIYVGGEDGEGHRYGKYLDYEDTIALVDQFELRRVPELHRGSFTECANHEYSFQTTVPDVFGLPPIENNTAEGIVIKPVRNHNVFLKGNARIAVKIKSENFQEVHPSQWSNVKKLNGMSEAMAAMYLAAEERINSQRLNNVVSKFGEPNKDDGPELVSLLVEDAFESLFEDVAEGYAQLTSGEQSRLTGEMNSMAKAVVNQSSWMRASE